MKSIKGLGLRNLKKHQVRSCLTCKYRTDGPIGHFSCVRFKGPTNMTNEEGNRTTCNGWEQYSEKKRFVYV
jgi:hypothetical protein